MNKASYELLAKQYIPDLDLKGCAHIDVGVHKHVIITEKDRRVISIPTVQRPLDLYKNEKDTLEYLQRRISSIHVARVQQIIEAPEAPAGYIVEMEHASGSELRIEDIPSYSPEELRQLGHQIGMFLAELHTMPLSQSLKIHPIPTPDIEKDASLLDKHNYWKVLDDFEREYVMGIYSRALPHFQTEITEVPLHNDFGMNHVFVEAHALSAVIDWDCQKVGDPAQDWRWAVGPRGIHPLCFTEALATYMQRVKLDPSFLGRVIYYNESKVVRMLAKAEGPESLARARKSIGGYREAMKYLYALVGEGA